MDLTVIRIKRAREAEPIDQISLASKKFKSDNGHTLCKVATLEDDKAPLKAVLKDAVAKLRQEKCLRQEQKKMSYQEMYKPKNVTKQYIGKQENIQKQKEIAASNRFKIISHSRGMSDIDEDDYSYLTKSDKFAVEFNDSPKVSGPSQGNDKLETEGASAITGRGVKIIDVLDHSMKNEETICMNDVPMEVVCNKFVYDIYVAAMPSGTINDLNIIEPPVIYNDYDACDSELDYDSEDSNAEDHYSNDYPEESDNDDGNEDEEYIDMDDLQLNLGQMNLGKNKTVHRSLGGDIEEFDDLFNSDYKDYSYSYSSAESDEES